MLELIRDYYRYQQWATARVLDTAARVPFGRLTISVLLGFEPARSSLVHVMWAQLHWLHRWQGLPRVPVYPPEHFPDLAALRDQWDDIDSRTHAFIASLTETRMTEPITYPGMKDKAFAYPLWQAMLHQANHATYHRGEVAAVLTNLGYSPGELDFFRMYDSQ